MEFEFLGKSVFYIRGEIPTEIHYVKDYFYILKQVFKYYETRKAKFYVFYFNLQSLFSQPSKDGFDQSHL